MSSLASYPLARSTARWSKWTFALFMLGLLLPFQLALLPLYTTMRDLNLIGTLWCLILFYSGLQMPFTVFLYTGISARYAARLRGSGRCSTAHPSRRSEASSFRCFGR